MHDGADGHDAVDEDAPAMGLAAGRIPGSIEEARTLVAYNTRVLETSTSRQRQHRARRMLINLQPHLARLEAEETDRVRRIETTAPPASTFDGTLQRFREAGREARELEVTWNGTMGRQGTSLTEGQGLGSSLGPGAGFRLRE